MTRRKFLRLKKIRCSKKRNAFNRTEGTTGRRDSSARQYLQFLLNREFFWGFRWFDETMRNHPPLSKHFILTTDLAMMGVKRPAEEVGYDFDLKEIKRCYL
jgi:hypothetical protein